MIQLLLFLVRKSTCSFLSRVSVMGLQSTLIKNGHLEAFSLITETFSLHVFTPFYSFSNKMWFTKSKILILSCPPPPKPLPSQNVKPFPYYTNNILLNKCIAAAFDTRGKNATFFQCSFVVTNCQEEEIMRNTVTPLFTSLSEDKLKKS